MQLSRFTIKGIEPENNRPFEAVCVSYDIVSAITYFRDKGFIVLTVPKHEFVDHNTKVCIESFHVMFDENKAR